MKRVRTFEDVKAARIKMGMTQAQLAAALRIPDPEYNGMQTVGRWEKGSKGLKAVPDPAQVAIEALLTGWRPSGFKS